MDVLRQLRAGFTRLHVLHHAEKDKLCGVEMMEELRRHGYKIGPGTFYPMLHDLESEGFIRFEVVVVGGKRRKNFTITAQGRKLLERAQAKVRELAGEILSSSSSNTKTKGRRTR
jgi:PadR family transcriptional regulator PadR